LAASELAGQPVLILKEGTKRARGREALHANITAARIIVEAVKSSLGPKGMDKMLVDSYGDVTITNDGATILDEMDVQHPAAKMMVEIAKTQDDEVGDGTTTAVILAGELLSKAEDLIEKGVHPTIIVDGYRRATEKALGYLRKIAVNVDLTKKDLLKRVAMVSMAGKILAEYKVSMADLAVKAILQAAKKTPRGYEVDVDDVKVEKKAGESLTDTGFVKGIVIDKEVVHPGMRKRVENARIAILNCALELEKTKIDAKINIEDPNQMKAFLDEEETTLKEMVDKITRTGAKVLICEKGIDDVAQHFLTKNGILAVRRVKQSDLEKIAKATSGKIGTNIHDLKSSDLGFAKLVEERRVGEDKMTFIEGCKNPKSVTILVRGGTERIVEEAERAIHDGLCVVRDVIQDPRVVVGGGAAETEVARRLRKYAEKFAGKEQLAIAAFAEALESIPMILAENAGLDPIDIMVQLRAEHDRGYVWAGVEPFGGVVADMAKRNVYEPLAVKVQALKSASEAAGMILRIDDLIAASKTKEEKTPSKGLEEGVEEATGEL